MTFDERKAGLLTSAKRRGITFKSKQTLKHSIMNLPILSPPVKRPHFVEPSTAVDVEHGRVEDLVAIRMDLLHGANYNDPAVFANRSYNQVMTSGGYGFGGMMGSRFY